MEHKFLVKKLAYSLTESVIQYRKAERECSDDFPFLVGGEESEERNRQYLERMKSRNNGEYVKLKRTEYWEDIIKAKIEVIAELGGIELMREVHDELCVHPENEKYNFASRFDWAADGVGEWYR